MSARQLEVPAAWGGSASAPKQEQVNFSSASCARVTVTLGPPLGCNRSGNSEVWMRYFLLLPRVFDPYTPGSVRLARLPTDAKSC